MRIQSTFALLTQSARMKFRHASRNCLVNIRHSHACLLSKTKQRLASAPLNRETKSCDNLFGVLFQLKAPILCNLVSVIYLQLNTRHCVQTWQFQQLVHQVSSCVFFQPYSIIYFYSVVKICIVGISFWGIWKYSSAKFEGQFVG